MYKFHTWIELRETTAEIDDGKLDCRVDELMTLVQQRHPRISDAIVRNYNGMRVFLASGCFNHRGSAHDDLLGVLGWIALRLPGSFGLTYWEDDEVPGRSVFDGHNVVVLARGTVQHRYDPFLSPIASVIED